MSHLASFWRISGQSVPGLFQTCCPGLFQTCCSGRLPLRAFRKPEKNMRKVGEHFFQVSETEMPEMPAFLCKMRRIPAFWFQKPEKMPPHFSHFGFKILKPSLQQPRPAGLRQTRAAALENCRPAALEQPRPAAFPLEWWNSPLLIQGSMRREFL